MRPKWRILIAVLLPMGIAGWVAAMNAHTLPVDLLQPVQKVPMADILSQALGMAEKLSDSSAKLQALQYLAPALAYGGNTPKALWIASQIKDIPARFALLSEIIPALSLLKDIQHAQSLAQQLPETWKSQCLRYVAVALARKGDIHQALSLIATILEEQDQFDALLDILPLMAQLQPLELRNKPFEQALMIAKRIHYEEGKVILLSEIAKYLAQSGYLQKSSQVFAQTMALTQDITDTEVKAIALTRMAHRMAQTNAIQQAIPIFSNALSSANQIKDDDRKGMALRDIVADIAGDIKPHMAAMLLRQAGLIARELKEPSERAYTQNTINHAAIQSKEPEQAITSLEATLSSIQMIKDTYTQSNLLIETVSIIDQLGHLPVRTQLLSRALLMPETFKNDYEKSDIRLAIAKAMLKRGNKAEANAIFTQERALAEKSKDTFLLTHIALALSQSSERTRASQIFTQAFLCERNKTELLSVTAHTDAYLFLAKSLIQHGDKARASQVFAEALAKTENIAESYWRYYALSTILQAIAQNRQLPAKNQLLAQFLTLSNHMWYIEKACIAQAQVAAAIAADGDFQKALALIEHMKSEKCQTEAFREMGQIIKTALAKK